MTGYEQLPVSTQHIPPSELWELINELREEVEAQGTKLRAQEAELARLRAPLAANPPEANGVKTSQNSSLPPASQIKPNQVKPAEPAAPRRQGQGHSRERQSPEVILECVPAACEPCGADLSDSLRRESNCSG